MRNIEDFDNPKVKIIDSIIPYRLNFGKWEFLILKIRKDDV